MRAEGFAKRCLALDAFSAGIDLWFNLYPLTCPEGNKPPLHQSECVVICDDRYRLAGCNIIPGAKFSRRGKDKVIVVPFGEFIWCRKAKTPAHRLRAIIPNKERKREENI